VAATPTAASTLSAACQHDSHPPTQMRSWRRSGAAAYNRRTTRREPTGSHQRLRQRRSPAQKHRFIRQNAHERRPPPTGVGALITRRSGVQIPSPPPSQSTGLRAGRFVCGGWSIWEDRRDGSPPRHHLNRPAFGPVDLHVVGGRFGRSAATGPLPATISIDRPSGRSICLWWVVDLGGAQRRVPSPPPSCDGDVRGRGEAPPCGCTPASRRSPVDERCRGRAPRSPRSHSCIPACRAAARW